ncbi:MAG TPA: LpxD N-terminal domain-containing protein, partial [Myxococcota bacterium]
MKLGDIAAAIGARLLGDADIEVVRVCAIDGAGVGDLAFVGHAHDRRAARDTAASAVLVDDDFAADFAHELPCSVLCSSDPSRALAATIALLHPLPVHVPRVHPSAVVADSAVVGIDVDLGAGVVVEDDVVVGAGSVVGPGCVLRRGVRLGKRVRLGPGCVVGDDGFVFASDGRAVQHVGSVVVDDDVWVGANVCIDRGLLRDTRIGARTKIDNLGQVAHDVVIGVDVVVAAGVGIAGYASIGD